MCLILFAYKAHEKYKLIVAANRDEDYARPTAPAHYWTDYPKILAGRDLKMMGTWMGVTQTGRFAALTNYHDPKEQHIEGKRSRGELVAGFLKSDAPYAEYMQQTAENRRMYPGYNLLAGDADELYYYSNRKDKVQSLVPGIYGVSNHLLNSDWPKVRRGKEILSDIIKVKDETIADQLLTLLHNADPAVDELLPGSGASSEWERTLSPMFIRSEHYGTRSSTVLLMMDSEIYFKERIYSPEDVKDRAYTIST